MAANNDTNDIKTHVAMFAKYRPGDSFFIEGGKRVDHEYLRRHFNAAGLGVEFCEVECDAKYGKPGLRIYRKEMDK